MLGLALEGGGARGAYHIGVVKAYLEHGYEFDGFVGTSIGAINAAMLAQGDFKKAHDLWMNISMTQIFDVDEQYLLPFMNPGELKLDQKLPSTLRKALSKIIEGRGVNTAKIKTILESYIDEEKVRNADKDFGLVTVSINELKPYELMLEDIPKGNLVDYIMASASFPGFQQETIKEKQFLDGGFYNNCPINLLTERGYQKVIAVRTNAPGIVRKVDDLADVTEITPRENLGSMMLFTQQNSEANITLGYYDGLRTIRKLRGEAYYINLAKPNDFYAQLFSLSDSEILEVGKILNAPAIPAKRMLFEHIVPQLGAHMKLKKDFDYADFVIALLERAATKRGIERFRVYDYGKFFSGIKNTVAPEEEKDILENVPYSNLWRGRKVAASLLTGHILKDS